MKQSTKAVDLTFAPAHDGLKRTAESVLAAIKARADHLAQPESAAESHIEEIARLAVAALNAASALYVAAGVRVDVREKP
jgi:hypothetical protein